MGKPEDDRLLARAKVVAVAVILALMIFITFVVLVAPIFVRDYDTPETSVIVMFPALSGILLALFGIRAFVQRNGD